MTLCTLCSTPTGLGHISEGSLNFCCTGCRVVFNILNAKNELSDYQNHPLFLQALRSGLISNPSIIHDIKQNEINLDHDTVKKFYIEIGNMWCPSCADIIRLITLKTGGVKSCRVDYTTDFAVIEYFPKYISKEAILSQIEKLGYQIQKDTNSKDSLTTLLNFRFLIAAFCAMNVMMFSYPIYASYFDYDSEKYARLFIWLSFFTSLPVVLYCGWPIYLRFFHGFRVGLVGMEALASVGITTAFLLSIYEISQGGNKVYFDTLSVIVVFILLGKTIESKAKFSAKEAILRLAKCTPKRGRKRFSDGTSQFVLIKEIQKGDLLLALSGEKIVLDGVILEGEACCDESLMTGETIPLYKKPGDSVLGGSVVQQGWILFRVNATSEATILHEILKIAEHEIEHKTRYVRVIDTITSWFVPLVCFLSILTGVLCYSLGIQDYSQTPLETALLRAIAILVISCPCAIGIAVPLAESQFLNQTAALGALIRNRACMSLLGNETIFVWDKTGTVTKGQFSVLSGLESIDPQERSILSGLASYSIHPISCAIVKSIQEKPKLFDFVQEVVSRGMKGKIGKDCYYLGSLQFLKEEGVGIPPTNQRDEHTVVYFAKNTEWKAKITLGDEVKEEIYEILESLKPSRMILLSGDHTNAVQQMAKKCNFDDWKAEVSPLQKKDYIESLINQGNIVCMVGDGINDAPSLARAHIGISVYSATEISAHVSDILLTSERLAPIKKIRILAQKCRKIIRQNLFWAFIYNILGIGLAALGILSPIFSSAAMAISSLIVVFNSKRVSAVFQNSP